MQFFHNSTRVSICLDHPQEVTEHHESVYKPWVIKYIKIGIAHLCVINDVQ